LRQPSRQFVRPPKRQAALPLPHLQKTWRDNPQPHGTDPRRKALILAAYHERMSMRGLARTFGVSRSTFGVSRSTVSLWLKKSEPSAAPKPDAGGGPAE